MASAHRVPAAGSRLGMLLAAVLAALLVVADQLIETWVDGHLLLMWVALWTVTFTMLAFWQRRCANEDWRHCAGAGPVVALPGPAT